MQLVRLALQMLLDRLGWLSVLVFDADVSKVPARRGGRRGCGRTSYPT